MSDLTQCNFCTLKSAQARAKGEGKKVVFLPDPLGGFGNGQRAYMIPKGTKLHDIPMDQREEHFVGWFAEITQRCVC